jgi:hypothetical protein
MYVHTVWLNTNHQPRVTPDCVMRGSVCEQGMYVSVGITALNCFAWILRRAHSVPVVSFLHANAGGDQGAGSRHAPPGPQLPSAAAQHQLYL